MQKSVLAIILAFVMTATLLTGCAGKKGKEKAETITVYLWSNVLYEQYAPYIQSQLPDINIQFVVGQKDLDFYTFMNENGELPDIIMSRRFSRHDALALKDSLMDLSTTKEAGAVYETYLSDFTNSDGTINWLPMCGVADGIVANKGLFDAYNIPLPTDYESFKYACKTFEEHGIVGFTSDFVYDYTCMELLQGVSIPEITSMDGSMWRSRYEDPDDEMIGLDNAIWPKVFENMEQFIQDAYLTTEDTQYDNAAVYEMFREGKLAMMRAGSSYTVLLNESGIETVFLPYFGQNGEQWILTYPEFQVALNKDLEKDNTRKEKALQVLKVMLSEGAQKTLSNNQDIITYYKNVKLELSPVLMNLQPLIEQNHIFIRIASNDFFAASKDVVTKMITGEYNAKQAYDAFNSQLEDQTEDESETVLTLEEGYSNIFYTEGGNAAYSAMTNTVRKMYGSDVVIASGFCFTGAVFAADYTEKQVTNMIMPNNLFAYTGQMSGAELKRYVKGFVEGVEGTKDCFTPFNRGSLPIVSGITIEVSETDGVYKLLSVKRNNKDIKDDDIFQVTCVTTTQYAAPFLEQDYAAIEQAETHLRNEWTQYILAGGTVEAPTNYITIKKAK